MWRLTASGWRVMSQPATRPQPSVGRLRPQSMRMAVVFPAPLAPRKPKISPGMTLSVMWSTAVKRPKRLVSPRVSMIGSVMAVGQFHETVFDPGGDGAQPGVRKSLAGKVGTEPVGVGTAAESQV